MKNHFYFPEIKDLFCFSFIFLSLGAFFGGNIYAGDGEGYPMQEAAISGDIEDLKQLIASGIDVDTEVDEDGCTPLHRAAFAGELRAVDFLVANGADMFREDNEGLIPLDYAQMTSALDVILFFHQRGVSSENEAAIVAALTSEGMKALAADFYTDEEDSSDEEGPFSDTNEMNLPLNSLGEVNWIFALSGSALL